MKKITLLFTLLFSSSLIFGQVVLTEDFEAGLTIPAGWTVEDLATPPNGEVWAIDNTGEAGGFTAGNTLVYDAGASGNYATFDSDGFGNNGTAEESTLTSPAFDCSSLTAVTLNFVQLYNGSFGGEASVEIFNGTIWSVAQTYPGTPDGTSPTLSGIESLDVSALAGVSNAQIRFRFIGNWSISWSIDDISVFQCTVSAPDPVVTAVSPANGATGVEINYGTPNNLGPIDWTAAPTGDAADSFNISLGEDTAGTDIGVISGFATGNSINFNWQPNTTYYWFIESVNCAGTTPGTVFSFTTAACTDTTPPAATSAPVPADGTIDVPIAAPENSLDFNWTAGSAGDDFILNLGTTNPPTQSFSNFENGDPIIGLAENTQYFWSVDAVNCFGTTPGPVWTFTTGVALSVAEEEIELLSAHPNPTSGILNIKTSLNVESIDVYSILGQNVASFDKRNTEDNSIDISNLSNGMYLIQISSGDRTQTIRVVKE